MALTRAEHLAKAEQHLKIADNWAQYGSNPQRVQAEIDAANAHLALADTKEK